MKRSTLISSILLATIFANAQSTTVAPPKSAYETKVYDSSFSTSSKVVIDKDEIQDSKSPNMSALLATKANINITNSAFQPNALLVRGGDSSQILIIIDDIPVYDASTIQRSFNLNSVNLNSVEKITVIKGSQSVWYGGQALSAVIKIDTLPKDLKPKTRVDAQGGSDNFRDLNGEVQQTISENSIAVVRGQYQFQNLSSPVEGSDFKYKRRKDNAEAVYYIRDDYSFNFKLSHYTDRNENLTGVSQVDFAAADTLDFVASTEVNQFQMAFRNNSVGLKPFLSIGFVDSHRVFSQNVNQYNSTEENQEYKSYLIPMRAEIRLWNSEEWKWDLGASFQKEGMLYESFKKEIANTSNEMIGTFSKVEYQTAHDYTFQAGYRYDTDLNFRDVSTYQIGMTYKDFKLEHSTGYRLPSLYQLYSNKGNFGLNPESSRTYTISYDKVWSEILETSATLFETHVENLIAARGNPLQYYNVGRTITKGVEAAVFYRHSYDQKITVNVGYQEPRDINSGKWLSRRPLKSASVVFSQKEDQKTFNLEIVGRGERDDIKNSTQTVRLEGYATMNASYIYRFTDYFSQSLALNDLSIYFRGQNLLSKKYDESYGYRNPGLEFFLGVRAGL
jgi:outer membrane cobalamin receptor